MSAPPSAQCYLRLAGQGVSADDLNKSVPPNLSGREWSGEIPWAKIESGVFGARFDLPLDWLSNIELLVPCFSATPKGDYSYQFVFENEEQVSLSTVGTFNLEILRHLSAGSSLSPRSMKSEIDLLRLNSPVEQLSVRLHVVVEHEESFLQSAQLFSLAVFSREIRSPVSAPQLRSASRSLDVPCLSQMELDPEVASRACSPTCVTMVLRFFGEDASPVLMASKTYNAEHDIFGQWPLSIHAASAWGYLGYLIKFSNWDQVMWCVEAGIPVIASIRYQAGELSNAAVPKTPGHIVVIREIGTDSVLVNDPGARSQEEVERRYDLSEFTNVWFNAGSAGDGLGYLILPQNWK